MKSRPYSPTVRIIFKRSKMKKFGSARREEPRGMDKFQCWVPHIDNKKIFMSVGLPRNSAGRCATTASLEDYKSKINDYIEQRQKLDQSFQPRAVGVYKVHVTLDKKPNSSRPSWSAKCKVTKHTFICSPKSRLYWNFFGLPHVTSNLVEV